MTRSLRLLILEFEDPPVEIFEKYGTYGDTVVHLLRHQLQRVAQDKALQVMISRFDVMGDDAYPDPTDFDAVFIPGSRHNPYDNDFWVPKLTDFIRSAYKAGKPIAAICYGHQIVGRALGGVAALNPKGWELGVGSIQLSAEGARLFGKDRINLHQMHRDAVTKLPPNVKAIGQSSRCDTQIMYEPGRVLGLQGHPELDGLTAKRLLQQRSDAGILDKETFEDAMARVEHDHDGLVVAEGIWRVLTGQDVKMEA